MDAPYGAPSTGRGEGPSSATNKERSGGAAAGRGGLALAAAIEAAVVPRLALLGAVEGAAAAPLGRRGGRSQSASAIRAGSPTFSQIARQGASFSAKDHRADVAITDELVMRVAKHALSGSADQAAQDLHALALAGVSTERLCLELVTPAARLMGVWWCEDRTTFADVTLGTAHLTAALRGLSEGPRDPEFWGALKGADRRTGVALIAACPGDHHRLGASVLSVMFERAGWRVLSGVGRSGGDLAQIVAQEPVDVVALSLSVRDMIPRLGALIGRLRRASKNPRLGVMVGGPAFSQTREDAARVGADACASDARRAVAKAGRLMALAHSAA
ncbi:MAG: cobalamin B12-binding domain-containing protein [Pseudomonadota bacterium]